jgi:hypothetical protein
LRLGEYFNQPIDNLPNSITHLELGLRFNQSIDNLPNSITYLKLGSKFNKPINNLPNSIIGIYVMYKNQFNLLPKKYHSITEIK